MSNSLNLLIKYRDYLKKIFPHLRGYIINKELIFKTNSNKILNFLTFLKNHTNSQYKVLSDICAVDFPQKENRFEVVYNLLSIAYNSRITIIVPTNESTPISSCVSIYSAAGWFEREVWDMFGIFFINHNDFRKILTDYGFRGHPLRKDFPLTGFTEVRYYDIEKRIILEEVSLAQDYRTFYFDNTWSTT
mgnify:CR=1 FL=1